MKEAEVMIPSLSGLEAQCQSTVKRFCISCSPT